LRGFTAVDRFFFMLGSFREGGARTKTERENKTGQDGKNKTARAIVSTRAGVADAPTLLRPRCPDWIERPSATKEAAIYGALSDLRQHQAAPCVG
jgi:hypothetical protein